MSELTRSALSGLVRMLKVSSDDKDGQHEQIKNLLCVRDSFVKGLLTLSLSNDDNINMSASQLLGHLSSSDDDHNINILINKGLLSTLTLKLSNNTITTNQAKEALWTLSNVSAGTTEQIKSLLNDVNLTQLIYAHLESESSSISREAMLIITNAICCG